MNEEKWRDKRNQAEKRLKSMLNSITLTQELGVLIGAEDDYCNILKYNVRSLLNYFDKRSVASRIRFVENVEDE